MGAFVLEIQNGTMVTPIPHYSAEEVQDGTAKGAWYAKCAIAVASTVEMHTVVLMADDGTVIKKEVFMHGVEE